MATLSFFSDTEQIENLNGSGLGFFGATFGNSVAVNAYQDSTYITNGAGTTQGPQVDNIKWTHPSSGSVNGTASLALTHIANRLATLNPRFTHSTAIRVQNAAIRIYDRSNINNPASGVTTKVAELVHPNPTNGAGGSGDSSWATPTGSSVTLGLVDSPGMSGLSPNGPSTTDTRHDWYLAISASPDSIGSKTLYGLYMSLEYL